MEVLALTTNESAPFMTQQMDALASKGVSFRTLSVDGRVDATTSRTPVEYVRFVPQVLREARNGYDLVHAHYGLTAPMALLQHHSPVVLSLWGTDLAGPMGPLTRLVGPLCDEVVVMSHAMRKQYGRSCTVIPDGVDMDLFAPEPTDEARSAVGWARDEYHVLFPYAPERRVKNFPRARRIVHAVDILLETPVHLHTVWGVPHEQMPTYMNAADVLLLTSRREGSPNAVKEAMACNLPVVSVDVGDVGARLESVDPSSVGRTDRELIDGLLSVLIGGARSNGREAVHSVSLERTTEAIYALYRRVTT